MSVQLIMREVSVKTRKIMLDLEVRCEMNRPFARAPRIELVFNNGWDNRRMVMPQQSYLPKKNDPTGKIWVAKARYTFFLRNVFWYGTWEDCKLSFDIDFDGTVYESVPIILKLRKTEFKETEQEKADEGEDEEDDNEIIEETDAEDSFEFGDNYIAIHTGEPVEIKPPVQPNKLEVVLGILLRIMNAVLGLVYIPWYMIDALGIIFLPTEKKDGKLDKYGFFGKFYRYVLWRYFSFCRNAKGRIFIKRDFMKIMYQLSNAFHRKKKTVLFLSNRRNDLSGNFESVHKILKERSNVKIEYWLNPLNFSFLSIADTFRIAWKCGKAKVILIDDLVGCIRTILISEDTQIIQLWHACGAFKTFGFSRLGKKGGPKQRVRSHRDYNYCFVSSKNIAKYYAEGFGLAMEKIIPYGVPRTDMFFDEDIKRQKRKQLFEEYPALEGKKVILFAPTFRGRGKNSAFYDVDKFDPNQVAASLPDDHVLLIKHHPFVDLKYKIAKKNKEKIFDFSDKSEINDLLFITDVLITDYSSVIYEASLLNIPMLFYAFDLDDYINSRDFYFEYEINVPGKVVYTENDLIQAILNNDYEHEKVEEFCRKNFDIRDGKASERIALFVENLALNKDTGMPAQ